MTVGMATTSHRGSCHCGAVQFTVELDASRPTSRCNCTICSKQRFWKAVVPGSAFRLLRGQEMLGEYRFGRDVIGHFFCRTCGVKTFGRGELESMGGVFYGVNIACLDDLTPAQLAALPVLFENGREDRWEVPPTEAAYL
jgi:hypothetical protein